MSGLLAQRLRYLLCEATYCHPPTLSINTIIWTPLQCCVTYLQKKHSWISIFLHVISKLFEHQGLFFLNYVIRKDKELNNNKFFVGKCYFQVKLLFNRDHELTKMSPNITISLVVFGLILTIKEVPLSTFRFHHQINSPLP